MALLYEPRLTSALIERFAVQPLKPNGFARGADHVLAKSLLQVREIWDDAQHPIDGGPMGIGELDTGLADDVIESFGWRPTRPARALGVDPVALRASWLATVDALYYVTPNIEAVSRWPWEFLRLAPIKIGRRHAKFVLDPVGAYPLQARLTHRGAANLLAIAGHYGAARVST